MFINMQRNERTNKQINKQTKNNGKSENTKKKWGDKQKQTPIKVNKKRQQKKQNGEYILCV